VDARKPHYLVVWEFLVKPEAQLAFEKIYGPAGDWALFFGQSPEYCGTQLLRDVDRSRLYLTLDHWTSSEALGQFKQTHRADYDAFDRQCESLTEHESLVGEFVSLSLAADNQ
jgi:hypothetical protein